MQFIAQDGWQWTALPDMPSRVSNNAVVSAYCGDTLCVYSFCGIDTTLAPTGIHLKSWRYNTISQTWLQLDDVPDSQGKIAAGASVVNNLIYLVGGYHVNANFSEVSSAKTHVYDPITNVWLTNAADVPVPIDDHVQDVWNDSLIFVVTGWSNNGNVPNAQIFDPANNEWSVGTPMPNFNNWKAFGASGAFVGDTLFYLGGASGSSFGATNNFRKGVVDSNDPTQIEWTQLDDFPGSAGYRMACTTSNHRIFWIGGSSTSYNFDADAYDNSGIVNPEERIATYYSGFALWEDLVADQGVMDLRGIARVSDNSWIICGGMEANQLVSNKTWLLEYDPSVSLEVQSVVNSSAMYANDELKISSPEAIQSWELLNMSGTRVFHGNSSGFELVETIPLSPGIYIVNVRFQNGISLSKKIVAWQ
jgi:N-acetylneuraminic acid mutarotase